jgi:IS30 family transposase
MGAELSKALERQVMDLLATGIGPMEVSRQIGVSKTTAYKLHHRVGGVYRPADVTYSERYLDRDERYELARLREAGHTIRQVAVLLGRAPSTVSRELRRNVRPGTGRYEPERADRLAWDRQRRPKASRLSRSAPLRQEVQGMLDKRYSPDQVAGRLKLEHAGDPGMQISHETIYQSLYVYPRGELKRELKAHLRRGQTTRKRRGRKENRGRIPNAVSIHDRPEEVEGRLVPGHHEGDLIKGTIASNSAVGTIVERTTGYLTLLHLPQGYGAHQVADAIITQMSALPDWFTKTLTWDRGTEMCQHAQVTQTTQIRCFFADPYSPWQRGSNENTNGLLREYMPKSTDLSIYTAQDLRRIAADLNDRPRKRLGYRTPREAFATLQTEQQIGVATTP